LYIRAPSQGRKEMFFGIRVIDGPPWLKETVGAPAAERPVFHAHQLELGFRRVSLHIASPTSGMSAGNSRYETEENGGRSLQGDFHF